MTAENPTRCEGRRPYHKGDKECYEKQCKNPAEFRFYSMEDETYTLYCSACVTELLQNWRQADVPIPLWRFRPLPGESARLDDDGVFDIEDYILV